MNLPYFTWNFQLSWSSFNGKNWYKFQKNIAH